jgi:hypothetical protein
MTQWRCLHVWRLQFQIDAATMGVGKGNQDMGDFLQCR